jgi:uncharacterized membrane protein YbhN (UPF0104 family)
VKRYKNVVVAAVLMVMLGLFGFYWRRHPGLINDIKNISPRVIIEVVLFYSIMLAVLVAIYDATLRLCQTRLPWREHTLLTMYSSIANFFGPLQSGPGVRSLYLKKRHNVKFSAYASASLIYYLFFGGWSGLFLITGIRPIWKIGVICALAIMLLVAMVFGFKRFNVIRRFVNTSYLTILARLALLTFVQVCLLVLIYFTELRSVNGHISLSQAITYTGAANFSLFVSLTPGALGFRESFLFFSQHLHHISGNNIIIANVIDRSAYLFFLALLMLAILAIHGTSKLTAKPATLK